MAVAVVVLHTMITIRLLFPEMVVLAVVVRARKELRVIPMDFLEDQTQVVAVVAVVKQIMEEMAAQA
jgi:hypothetical protein